MLQLWDLRRENKQLMQELKAVHYSTYLELKRCLQPTAHTRVNAYDMELIKRDVIGMVIEGAKRGETFDDIMQGDGREFLTDLLVNCRKRSRPESVAFLSCTFFLGVASCMAIRWLLPVLLVRAEGMLRITVLDAMAAVLMGLFFSMAWLRSYIWSEGQKKKSIQLVIMHEILLLSMFGCLLASQKVNALLLVTIAGWIPTLLFGGVSATSWWTFHRLSAANQTKG